MDKSIYVNTILKPEVSHRIAFYLPKEDNKSLARALPAFACEVEAALYSQGYDATHICTKFSLYKRRSAGNKPCPSTIYQAGGLPYTPSQNESLIDEKKHPVGFFVVIPVPYLHAYKNIGDRDPEWLVSQYIAAIPTSCVSHGKSRTYPSPSQCLRVLLALNLYDNPVNTNQSSLKNKRTVEAFSNKLNKKFIQLGYPAWVIPALWSINAPKKHEYYYNDALFDWGDTKADEVRAHIRLKGASNTTLNFPSFPFATMRSFLIDSPPGQMMIEELSQRCKHVYCVTGDADLISLHPTGNLNESIFNPLISAITSPSIDPLFRLGGAYDFDNDDIKSEIMSVYPDINATDLLKSQLITRLVRALDLATRAFLARMDPALVYYSEAFTALSTHLFSPKQFIHVGKESCPELHRVPLVKKLQTSRLREPDISPQITRDTCNKESWLDISAPQAQQFMPEYSARIITSSRRNVIVLDSSKSLRCKANHQASLKRIFANKHYFAQLRTIIQCQTNHQLKAKQINSRFDDAKYGRSVLHKMIDLLNVVEFPFLRYYLSKKNSPMMTKIFRKQEPLLQSGALLTLFDCPNSIDEKSIYSAIKKIPCATLPDNAVIPSELEELKVLTGKKINKFKKSIPVLLYHLEHLLRWGVKMLHIIIDQLQVNAPYNKDRCTITV